MNARPLVYIAGPYTLGDPVLNTRAAIEWAEAVEDEGCDVVVPHLSMLWHAISPAPVGKWYERDLAVLARCDALLRFPGASEGADAEVEFAKDRGIPVFMFDGREFVEWASFRKWVDAYTDGRQEKP